MVGTATFFPRRTNSLRYPIEAAETGGPHPDVKTSNTKAQAELEAERALEEILNLIFELDFRISNSISAAGHSRLRLAPARGISLLHEHV